MKMTDIFIGKVDEKKSLIKIFGKWWMRKDFIYFDNLVVCWSDKRKKLCYTDFVIKNIAEKLALLYLYYFQLWWMR
jgi:hypothetical protein